MNEAVYSFHSYSGAAKAYDILKMNHIPSKIYRTTASSAGSCGYSIKVSAENSNAANNILRNYNLIR